MCRDASSDQLLTEFVVWCLCSTFPELGRRSRSWDSYAGGLFAMVWDSAFLIACRPEKKIRLADKKKKSWYMCGDDPLLDAVMSIDEKTVSYY